MRKIALFAVLAFSTTFLGAGILTAHAESQNKRKNTSETSQSEKKEAKVVGKKKIQVKSGDTLSKIAVSNGTTYLRIYYANESIKNPDIIHPGEKVRIPHPNEKLKERPLPTAEVAPAQPSVAPRPATQPAAINTNVDGGVWDRLAACESGGNWAINTGNGFYGGLQFDLGTWQSNGGSGYPHQASKAEQIRVAENLRAARGFSPWPACSAQLGL